MQMCETCGGAARFREAGGQQRLFCGEACRSSSSSSMDTGAAPAGPLENIGAFAASGLIQVVLPATRAVLELPLSTIERSKTLLNIAQDVDTLTQIDLEPVASDDAFKLLLTSLITSESYPSVDVRERSAVARRVRPLGDAMLFEVWRAANFLDIDYVCRATVLEYARRFLDSEATIENLRERFSIVNDFTPEMQAQVELESTWPEVHLDGVADSDDEEAVKREDAEARDSDYAFSDAVQVA